MDQLTSNVDCVTDIPGYKTVLKAVLRYQIQQLVEQLSIHADEECVVIIADVVKGTLGYLGSARGKAFISSHDDVKRAFLPFGVRGQDGVSEVSTSVKECKDSGKPQNELETSDNVQLSDGAKAASSAPRKRGRPRKTCRNVPNVKSTGTFVEEKEVAKSTVSNTACLPSLNSTDENDQSVENSLKSGDQVTVSKSAENNTESDSNIRSDVKDRDKNTPDTCNKTKAEAKARDKNTPETCNEIKAEVSQGVTAQKLLSAEEIKQEPMDCEENSLNQSGTQSVQPSEAGVPEQLEKVVGNIVSEKESSKRLEVDRNDQSELVSLKADSDINARACEGRNVVTSSQKTMQGCSTRQSAERNLSGDEENEASLQEKSRAETTGEEKMEENIKTRQDDANEDSIADYLSDDIDELKEFCNREKIKVRHVSGPPLLERFDCESGERSDRDSPNTVNYSEDNELPSDDDLDVGSENIEINERNSEAQIECEMSQIKEQPVKCNETSKVMEVCVDTMDTMKMCVSRAVSEERKKNVRDTNTVQDSIVSENKMLKENNENSQEPLSHDKSENDCTSQRKVFESRMSTDSEESQDKTYKVLAIWNEIADNTNDTSREVLYDLIAEKLKEKQRSKSKSPAELEKGLEEENSNIGENEISESSITLKTQVRRVVQRVEESIQTDPELDEDSESNKDILSRTSRQSSSESDSGFLSRQTSGTQTDNEDGKTTETISDNSQKSESSLCSSRTNPSKRDDHNASAVLVERISTATVDVSTSKIDRHVSEHVPSMKSITSNTKVLGTTKDSTKNPIVIDLVDSESANSKNSALKNNQNVQSSVKNVQKPSSQSRQGNPTPQKGTPGKQNFIDSLISKGVPIVIPDDDDDDDGTTLGGRSSSFQRKFHQQVSTRSPGRSRQATAQNSASMQTPTHLQQASYQQFSYQQQQQQQQQLAYNPQYSHNIGNTYLDQEPSCYGESYTAQQSLDSPQRKQLFTPPKTVIGSVTSVRGRPRLKPRELGPLASSVSLPVRGLSPGSQGMVSPPVCSPARKTPPVPSFSPRSSPGTQEVGDYFRQSYITPTKQQHFSHETLSHQQSPIIQQLLTSQVHQQSRALSAQQQQSPAPSAQHQQSPSSSAQRQQSPASFAQLQQSPASSTQNAARQHGMMALTETQLSVLKQRQSPASISVQQLLQSRSQLDLPKGPAQSQTQQYIHPKTQVENISLQMMQQSKTSVPTILQSSDANLPVISNVTSIPRQDSTSDNRSSGGVTGQQTAGQQIVFVPVLVSNSGNSGTVQSCNEQTPVKRSRELESVTSPAEHISEPAFKRQNVMDKNVMQQHYTDRKTPPTGPDSQEAQISPSKISPKLEIDIDDIGVLSMPNRAQGSDISPTANTNIFPGANLPDLSQLQSLPRSDLKSFSPPVSPATKRLHSSQGSRSRKSSGGSASSSSSASGAAEKKFGCGDCGKSFSSKGALNVHFKKHTQDRPFECDVCGKHFSQKGYLKKHIRSHFNEKQQ